MARLVRIAQSRFIKALEINNRICSYESAYKDYYKIATVVQYEKGWYWVHKRRVRASELEKMTERLLVLAHVQSLEESL